MTYWLVHPTIKGWQEDGPFALVRADDSDKAKAQITFHLGQLQPPVTESDRAMQLLYLPLFEVDAAHSLIQLLDDDLNIYIRR